MPEGAPGPGPRPGERPAAAARSDASEGAASDRVELLVERRATSIALLSPGVGLFTGAREVGDLLAPGADAGALLVLGRAVRLVVPPGIEGRVATPPPALTRQPVGWGELLYEIRPGVASEEPAAAGASGAAVAPPRDGGAAEASARLLVRSPQGGRFYLRPAVGEAPFVTAGARVEQGQSIGLIEVMKTFAHLRYGGEGLPATARVIHVLVEDGAEVAVGDALLEVEPDPVPGPSSSGI